METLGSRIRKLRNNKGLTLQALAGTELSKGMLSLIENDKAKPSMESLSYIASRLDVDADELLQEIPSSQLRDLLQQAESLYAARMIESPEEDAGLKELIRLLGPYLSHLPRRYESARLLELYSRAAYYRNQSDWTEALDRAERMYEELHLPNRSADIQLFRAMQVFHQHDYAGSLRIVREARARFDEYGAVLEPLKRLDFDYHEAILYFAVDEPEPAREKMEEAIAYSRKNRIFYRIDDLYRLACMHALLTGNKEEKDYYLHKLRQYAAFAEHRDSEMFADLLEAHFCNSFEHSPERAEALIDRYLAPSGEASFSLLLLEKGKALYSRGQLKEAEQLLRQHKIEDYLHHPFDLAISYEKDAYLALIYQKLGETERAQQHAAMARANIGPLPDSPYKRFIYETYDQIMH